MAKEKLRILQRLGVNMAESEDAKRLINNLRTGARNELYGLLLTFVRRKWLTHEEFYLLLPPSDYAAVGEVRDVLLAVAYEWQQCHEREEEFAGLYFNGGALTADATLLRIQQIGQQWAGQVSTLSRWVGRLQTARSPDKIRSVYLNAVQRGMMTFDDFVFMCPLDEVGRYWLLRDYLLAFLFDRSH